MILEQKYTIYIFLIFLSVGNLLTAQDYYNSSQFKKFDLEKKEINKSKSDSVAIFLNHWDEKAQKSGDSVAMAYVWMTGALMSQRVEKLQEALDYGLRAEEIINSYSLSDRFTYNTHYLSTIHVELGNYERAIELALQSTDEFKSQDPYANKANFHVLADAYLSMHNYQRMDHYLGKWHALVKESDVRMDLGFAVYIMQEFYDIAGMYEKASFYQNEFYKFYAESGKEISHIPEHAFITITGDSPEETIQKLLKYLPYHLENDRSVLITKTKRQLGRLYLDIGNPSKAVEYLEDATNNSDEASIENQIDALQGLSDAYSQTGQYEYALASANKYIALRDSFKNDQVLAQANELEVKYESEKKELQLELKETQIQAKNKWLLFSAIGGVIVLAFAGFVFFLYKKLRTSNHTLSKTLGEKETLLQEIHHRVKNNLQVISSLLSLQSKYVKDENAISALNEGQNRVESMALIHQNLYREDNISGVNMKSYIPLLADNIFNSYNIQGDKIKIEYEIDELILDVSTVIPIGLVLNELISNALKYAFPNTNSGVLKISLREKSNALLLAVTDDGIGLQNSEAASGFGTKLINSFTRKLEGELTIKSEKGTSIEILIKNFKRA